MNLLRSSRAAVAIAPAALVVGLLAGCGGNGLATSDPGKGSGVTSPSASAASSPSADASSSPSPSTTASVATGGATPRPVATSTTAQTAPGASDAPATSSTAPSATSSTSSTCPASGLAIGVREPEGGGAAGSRYVLLTFRNRTDRTCTLDGHPGVSFVGRSDGTQLGEPAARTGGVRTVRLGSGETTTALLRIGNAGNYPAGRCAPTTADGLRVYPPDSRASRFVAFRVQACQGDLGADRQLTVSAVGRAD